MISERIDYIKLNWLANEVETADSLRERFEGFWAQYETFENRQYGKATFNRVYDGRGNWKYTYEISGPAADAYLELFLNPLTDYQYITRLDYRFELDTIFDKVSFDTIYANILALNTGNRNVGHGHARPRDKGPKRDGGGDRIWVGSLLSDKYLAVYQKPGESAAVEVKLSGTPLTRILQEVRTYGRVHETPAKAMRHRLISATRHSAATHVYKITGTSIDEFGVIFDSSDMSEHAEAPGNRAHLVLSEFKELSRYEQMDMLKAMVDTVYPEGITFND